MTSRRDFLRKLTAAAVLGRVPVELSAAQVLAPTAPLAAGLRFTHQTFGLGFVISQELHDDMTASRADKYLAAELARSLWQQQNYYSDGRLLEPTIEDVQGQDHGAHFLDYPASIIGYTLTRKPLADGN